MAYEEKKKILASKPLRAALAHFTDEVFCDSGSGRAWLITPFGLKPYLPANRIDCWRFDEEIPRHPGVRPDYSPRPTLQESVR